MDCLFTFFSRPQTKRTLKCISTPVKTMTARIVMIVDVLWVFSMCFSCSEWSLSQEHS